MKPTPLFLLCITLAACQGTSPASQPTAHALPEAALTLDDTTPPLKFLADDALLGRAAGTPGADTAAHYIARRFRAVGLTAPPKADGYFQHVPLVRTQTPQGRTRLALDEDPTDDDGFTAPNVAGIVNGHDPALRDTFIVLTAHYDHVGAGLDKPRATPADSIFNGARDNAMGIVALLGAAKALQAKPPRRSVLILAVTAEESGLLGSRYYVEHPLVPLEQTAFVLNIDGAGYNDTSAVTIIGLGRTTADTLLHAGPTAFGLKVLPDPVPEQNLFNRSDNAPFARKGVPALTFSEGFTAFDDQLMQYYHQPADEADEAFDYAYLLRFTQAYAHTARRLADHQGPLQWLPGDPFEGAARRLYGR